MKKHPDLGAHKWIRLFDDFRKTEAAMVEVGIITALCKANVADISPVVQLQCSKCQSYLHSHQGVCAAVELPTLTATPKCQLCRTRKVPCPWGTSIPSSMNRIKVAIHSKQTEEEGRGGRTPPPKTQGLEDEEKLLQVTKDIIARKLLEFERDFDDPANLLLIER